MIEQVLAASSFKQRLTCLLWLSLLPGLLWAHGILPKEEQFHAGVPVGLPEKFQKQFPDGRGNADLPPWFVWQGEQLYLRDGHISVPVIPVRLATSSRKESTEKGLSAFSVERSFFSLDEQVLFYLENRSRSSHLVVLGTPRSLQDQALMHSLLPDSYKDYPNTRYLLPGEKDWLHWRFNRSGDFALRCLMEGHDKERIVLRVSEQKKREK